MSGREGKSWETQAYICIHVSTYAYIKTCRHTQGKQNKPGESIAQGPPPGRGRGSKQAADVNCVTAPSAAGTSAPWDNAGGEPPEQEAAGDTQAGEDHKAERS